MKIAIIGYGRMGQAVERVAVNRGHKIAARIDVDNAVDILQINRDNTDIAIEFSTPDTAKLNVQTLLRQDVPVVCGTTGWDVDALKVGYEKGRYGDAGLIISSNFSVGVNLFFAINSQLAKMMHGRDYSPTITETHHIHKLDRPSGTAKTLASLIKAEGYNQVPTASIREGEVAGIHTVGWFGNDDSIVLTHEAHSRDGFALGAVVAAEWLCDKHGWHTMAEVLGIRDVTA